MQLYPAIDLMEGKCVRLRQGSFQNVSCYSESPAEVAALWEKEGATFIHVVDLDGALSGSPVNEKSIREIINAVSVPVEVGGGIRDIMTAGKILTLGVTRVITGTQALKDPGFISEMIGKFGSSSVAVGVDAKDGMVAINGWEKVSSMNALEFCKQMKENGVAHIIYTDIARDGMMTGPNVRMTSVLTEKTGIDIIASGGISSMQDLENLKNAGIKGAVIGKALYEKKIDLREAVHKFQQE